MVTVSVVIPTYNSADTLSRAIDSVLNQTFADFELIVVDDASEDSTEDVISDYGDRVAFYQHNVNRGGSAARNTGIKHANGQYISFLDADDEWLPEKLELQVNELQKAPDTCVAVYCNRSYVTNYSGKIREFFARLVGTGININNYEGGDELIKEILLMNFSTGASTLVVKKDTIEEIGGFNPNYPRHQDWEFLIRVLKEGKLIHINQSLVIKHDTGQPGPETFEKGKELLLSDFSDDISQLESRGYKITQRQHHHLGKIYLENGQIRAGFSYINLFELTFPQLLGVGWSFSTGLTELISK